MEEVTIDPQIRDWVLIPIVLVMFMVGILRHHITRLVKGEPKADPQTIAFRQVMSRTDRLRHNASEIPLSSFQMRKSYFADAETGKLMRAEESEKNPLQDSAMMVEMMKNNITMVVSQMGMMGVVSTFFAGFITVKLPFPLSNRFKVMLQRGVELNSLDVTYVSSLSWYFLNLFGLRGLFSLVLGEDNETDDAKIMQSQMGGGGPMGPGQDPGKIMKQQAENLEVVHHDWAANNAEQLLLSSVELTPAEREVLRGVLPNKKKD